MLRRMACNIGCALSAPSTSGRSCLLGCSSSSLLDSMHYRHQQHQQQESKSHDRSYSSCQGPPLSHFPISPCLGSSAGVSACQRFQPHQQLSDTLVRRYFLHSNGHQQQLRSIFGARVVQPNPQIHSHDKYKFKTSQPTYE